MTIPANEPEESKSPVVVQRKENNTCLPDDVKVHEAWHVVEGYEFITSSGSK